VLDLYGFTWLENERVKHIGSFRQLRYLKIRSSKITKFPGLQHLETLDLSGCLSLMRLPSIVVQLQKLVRLFVDRKTRLPAAEFGSMQTLETLDELNSWNTDNPMRFAEEVGHLTNLRKLQLRSEKPIGEIMQQ
jgi:hypothetical protein